ncbi:aminoglycoside resistance protein [Aeromicrobium sp. CFBP 8757]|uniref:aminoglycoside phosphotransferase family protein n=1 Tax=Aeromicrobium sp. CFBP 8757 TaxID=2775288 RepID=UPI00177A7A21|nr:aminoglycoside phosphotransferase family protein [Aeromicrobium sp. CFBP 8757]MBD8605281.1 aminoglycoside resistance protein [Aeromicrobium sp. CFBP 8757]
MALLPFDLPAGFTAQAERDEQWATWVAGVPRLVRGLLDEWGLRPDGAPMHGRTALVVPVVADGVPAVLKVAGPGGEGQHEILGLQTWHGRGAVRLLQADPRRSAMLLERLHPDDLSSLPVLAACEAVAALYPLLHVPAPPQLVPLTRLVERWTDDLGRLPRRAPLPHRIVEQAVHLGRAFTTDADSTGRMIHGDLHYAHVLAADRAPWLAIDPEPVSGDPHYELAPLLSSRWDEVVATGDVRTAVRRRFHAVVDAAGLDEDRARDWVVVREAHRAMWAIEDGDADRVTAAIAIVKAVQD